MSEVYKIALTALIVAFAMLVLTKTGLRDKTRDAFDSKQIAFMADMIECDFCLSFWISVCICISAAIYNGDISWLSVPVFSTPLTRILL